MLRKVGWFAWNTNMDQTPPILVYRVLMESIKPKIRAKHGWPSCLAWLKGPWTAIARLLLLAGRRASRARYQWRPI
jgi:hypothetical protein